MDEREISAVAVTWGTMPMKCGYRNEDRSMRQVNYRERCLPVESEPRIADEILLGRCRTIGRDS